MRLIHGDGIQICWQIWSNWTNWFWIPEARLLGETLKTRWPYRSLLQCCLLSIVLWKLIGVNPFTSTRNSSLQNHCKMAWFNPKTTEAIPTCIILIPCTRLLGMAIGTILWFWKRLIRLFWTCWWQGRKPWCNWSKNHRIHHQSPSVLFFGV